jgi:ATP-binding cassette subfamily B protein
MRQTLIVMSRHIEFDLKNEVFRQYERLSQNFYKQHRTGDLMNRISEDVGKTRMYVGGRYVHDQHGDSLCNRHCLYV